MMRIAILPANQRVRDANGNWAEFSHADLDEIARSYDAANPAPIVVGHPKLDSPAFGWWERLERVGDYLFASTQKVKAAFAKAFADGDFKKYSASIFPRHSTANPTPGKLNLRHVGFLGAASPAFGELFTHPDNDFGMAFASPLAPDTLDFSFDFKVGLMDLNALKAIEGDITPADIAAAMGVDVAMLESLLTPDEPPPEESAEFAELRHQNTILKARMDAMTLERKRERCLSFCEGLMRAGKPLPKPLPDMVEFLVSLDDGTTQDFAESKAVSPLQFAMDTLSQLPKQVEFGEVAGGTALDFSEDPVTIAESATRYQKAQAELGRTISISQAVKAIKEGKGAN